MKITINKRKQGQFIEITTGDDRVFDQPVLGDLHLPTALRDLANRIEKSNAPDQK